MNPSNKNILEVYQNYKDSPYILNNFTDNQQIGLYLPHKNNPFKESINKKSYEIQVVDRDNEYTINALGLRGNIKKDPDTISLGCSYTFGVGIPENGTWPDILAKQTGKNILNLGVPGSTIKKLSELAIRYSSKYEKPKTIFALFPGFFRNMLIEDINFYSSSRNMHPTKQSDVEKQSTFQSKIYYDRNSNYMVFKNTNASKFFKSKEKNIKYMENVLSPHQLISDAIDSIATLQDFCHSHKIDFYWSTWDIPSSILMDTLLEIPEFKLKNYIKFAKDEFNNYLTNDGKFPNHICSSTHDSELIVHPSWDRGSDICVDFENNILESWPSHPGIHFQHHVADLFKGYSTS
jgi:hypothetical protein